MTTKSIIVAAIVVASPAFAQATFAQTPTAPTSFNGTWKVDVASAKLSTKPDTWSIKDGVYNCSTCVPAVKTMADGKVHAVPGHDYFDAMSVTVVDPTKVRYTYMRGGKTVTDSSDTIGPDGASLTSEWTTTDNAKGETVTGKGVMKRVGASPAGEHATSGSWIRTNDVQLSDQVLTLTLRVDGERLTMVQPTGETYSAAFGGPKVPLRGDSAGTMVAVKRAGDGLVETDYRRGKAVSRFAMMPLSPGRMRFVSTDLQTNSTSEFIGVKQ